MIEVLWSLRGEFGKKPGICHTVLVYHRQQPTTPNCQNLSRRRLSHVSKCRGITNGEEAHPPIPAEPHWRYHRTLECQAMAQVQERCSSQGRRISHVWEKCSQGLQSENTSGILTKIRQAYYVSPASNRRAPTEASVIRKWSWIRDRAPRTSSTMVE